MNHRIKSVKSINRRRSAARTMHDIITQEHNGTIKVESTEGVGTEFIIQLPTV